MLGPVWLQRAFADSSVGAPARAGLRRSELERKRRGPTLVLIIPEDDDEKWNRGRAFGEWLNHGSDDDLAPLAHVEVVCAYAREVPSEGASPGDEPLLAWLYRGQVRALDGTLPAYEDARVAARDDEKVFRARVALLAGLVRDAIGTPPPSEVHARAALVRKRIVDGGRPPAGSHWASYSGCGTKVEETPEEIEAKRRRREAEQRAGLFLGERISVVGCGMGHVPEKSRRFLYFLTRATDG
jgi:hypothetical protein